MSLVFCANCKSIMMPRGGKLCCRKCGAEQEQLPGDVGTMLKREREHKDVPVIEKDEASLPTIERECPKCSNGTCYFWVIQTRSSDEPPTRFFRCAKCRHTWREYS